MRRQVLTSEHESIPRRQDAFLPQRAKSAMVHGWDDSSPDNDHSALQQRRLVRAARGEYGRQNDRCEEEGPARRKHRAGVSEPRVDRPRKKAEAQEEQTQGELQQ